MVYTVGTKYILYDNIKIGGLSPTIEPEKLNKFKIESINKTGKHCGESVSESPHPEKGKKCTHQRAH